MVSWKKLKSEMKRKLKIKARKILKLTMDYFNIEPPCKLSKKELITKILSENPRYLNTQQIYDLMSNSEKYVIINKYYVEKWKRRQDITIEIIKITMMEMHNTVRYDNANKGLYLIAMKAEIDALLAAGNAVDAVDAVNAVDVEC